MYRILAALVLCSSLSRCSGESEAQEVLPYAMTCEPAPADGTAVRRCFNTEVVCYILNESISCRGTE